MGGPVVRPALVPNADQKAAMTAANSPSAINPFATMSDVVGGGGGATTLDELTDVVIATPLVDETVKWDGTAVRNTSGSFALAIAGFSASGLSSPILIGSGQWKAAGRS